ncbi:hypothetical protein H0H93_014332 [Arthromyces matolae]|nr:hypothetical protein H0H93_014332 [Arthromyces matolae]
MAGAAGFSNEGGGGDSYMAEVLRRKQFAEAHRRRANYARPERPFYEASADDRMKDRVIIIIGGVALFLGVAPGLFMLPSSLENSHRSAVANLRQARLEAQELGEERMIEVRKRARDIRRKQGSNDDDLAASD